MDSKRPLLIDLSRNRLTFLNESIFLPLIGRDINQIDLNGNPLKCDCNIKWLLRDKNKVIKQILNAICTDGKPLLSHTLEEINAC